ncbi:hypothetical protein ABW20_dc0107639 [Dactylellina cionopaga]|nr:hypothetical protein ABW20_dc0107639 [Dactylellina cionopaga]
MKVELWRQLEILQSTVSGLKLQTLYVWGTLFHPSFLLAPPAGCRTVAYYGAQMSTSWWRKFANQPFTGVENMWLHCINVNPEGRDQLIQEGEEVISPMDNLELDDIEISSLVHLHLWGGDEGYFMEQLRNDFGKKYTNKYADVIGPWVRGEGMQDVPTGYEEESGPGIWYNWLPECPPYIAKEGEAEGFQSFYE